MNTTTPPVCTMTVRQANFVSDMLAELYGDKAADVLAKALADGRFATWQATRESINALVETRDAFRAAKPKAGPTVVKPLPFTPGYYAVDYLDVLRFYRVNEGAGKWRGRLFVNRFRSDDEVKVSRTEADAVMALIAADPAAAAKRFSVETVLCCRCARRLTDPLSKELGIGPDCRRK